VAGRYGRAARPVLSEHLKKAAVEVRKDYGEIPMLEAEAGLLNQVWMNLIGNAIDALEGRERRELHITLRAAGDGHAADRDKRGGGSIEIEIADTGCGIEPADMGRIFEPFFTTKPVGRGTGLGLSTAYSAVKSHGGRIEVDSTPGVGTTFRVRLPAVQHPL
jgi:two-component system, NtrC family, sensor kinase